MSHCDATPGCTRSGRLPTPPDCLTCPFSNRYSSSGGRCLPCFRFLLSTIAAERVPPCTAIARLTLTQS
eukprot:4182882-Pleurochrysis_carterae.AAC.2